MSRIDYLIPTNYITLLLWHLSLTQFNKRFWYFVGGLSFWATLYIKRRRFYWVLARSHVNKLSTLCYGSDAARRDDDQLINSDFGFVGVYDEIIRRKSGCRVLCWRRRSRLLSGLIGVRYGHRCRAFGISVSVYDKWGAHIALLSLSKEADWPQIDIVKARSSSASNVASTHAVNWRS